MTSEKGQPGQYFEDFLKEQDTYESTTEQAVKRVLAYQLSEEIKTKAFPSQRWPAACTLVDHN